ncbi:MAG: HAD-IC family P-type ATPase [Ectothiorhodospiraceae bacterium]|nr:HAD-IC family P-type ATPase [Ectothiorhodospiraceae bacterium]
MTPDPGAGPPLDWPRLAPAEVLRALDTSPEGLASAAVDERRAGHGANVLPRPPRAGPVSIYLRQFRSPFIYLLLAAAAISLAIAELGDALFIFAVLQINAVIGTVQEWRAETGAEALDRMVRSWVVVRRAGARARIDSVELVRGDVVVVEPGLHVPADLRLLTAQELRVDESTLTGESTPVTKDPLAVPPAGAPLAELATMLHTGTVVLAGRATAVVVHTAPESEVGRIAVALADARRRAPPLVRRLERFSRVVAVGIVAAVALLAIAQIARGTPATEILLLAIALAVSAIPEGLPVAITVALSIATHRMAARQVLVRKLPVIEGLGACTVIASDKTGTLTVNELTARMVALPGLGLYAIENDAASAQPVVVEGAPLAVAVPMLERLALAACLTNEASLQLDGTGAVRHFGDTVDVALLVLATRLGLDPSAARAAHPEIATIPYESARRYSAAYCRDGDDVVVAVKGAAETVLRMCGASADETAAAAAQSLSEAGYRVIAVAEGRASRDAPPPPTDAEPRDLVLLGMVGIIDPLRPEAPEAVRRCAEAGIAVCMVTGDHPATALAIARELGIASPGDSAVTGVTLAGAGSPEAFDALTRSSRVFARLEPMHKLALVESLQRQGHAVAVTGDGVNDAPALRAADIGVAMGRGGTDVARSAADIILADDHFASIVAGIEQGRVAYDNVRKVVYLLLSTGAAELVVFALAVMAGLPVPLYAAQLLWLNLVTNGIQDVALAFERGEADVLRRPPRPPRERLFDRRMVEQVLLSGMVMGALSFALFAWCLAQGMATAEARNVLLLMMVLFEGAHVFNCRSETHSALRQPIAANPLVVAAAVIAIVLHVGAMYSPLLQGVLRVAPVAAETWLVLVPLGLSLVLVMETYKWLRRR